MVKSDDILWINSAIYVLENKINQTDDFFKRKEMKEILKKMQFDKHKMETTLEEKEKETMETKATEEKVVSELTQRDEEIKKRITSYL